MPATCNITGLGIPECSCFKCTAAMLRARGDIRIIDSGRAPSRDDVNTPRTGEVFLFSPRPRTFH